ncbi:hypothetical protein VPH35_118731 [Triticum aestivum]|uniref:F-box domain-containing protein n=1 Tax=Aegilops tauschii TaxID=37682 RepID=N1R289_AEGTA
MAKPSAAKGLNGSDRWSSVEPEDDREDRLSSLPDDVLLNVVERLGIAGATRTGILSGRWRRIPGMISKLRLAVGSSDPERDRSKLSCVDDVVRANAAMAEAIRSMPENRSTGPYAVRLLCLQFFLGHEDIAVGQAIADTMSMEDIGLAELTLLTRKDGRRFGSNLKVQKNVFSHILAREEADLWGSDDDFSGDDGGDGCMAPVIDLTGGSDEE